MGVTDDRARRVVPGTSLFASFLRKNGISYESASKSLKVSRVTVGHWASGFKRPAGNNPSNIETWTNGDVPASSWRDPDEERVVIEPFRPDDSLDSSTHVAASPVDIDLASGED
jgi:hypothetical protein